jgi:hypothetical protein
MANQLWMEEGPYADPTHAGPDGRQLPVNAPRPERWGQVPRTFASRSAAVGALAVGALALGALAIGALAIGHLVIKRARIGRLEIDELVVRRLKNNPL